MPAAKSGRGRKVAPSPEVEGFDPKKLEPQPVEEMVARFQVDTQAVIDSVRSELGKQLALVLQKCANHDTALAELRTQFGDVARKADSAEHVMRQGVKEVNEALRVAVGLAREAQESAKVYEALRESQPDLRGAVVEAQERVGRLSDKLRLLEAQLQNVGLSVDRNSGLLKNLHAHTDSNTRMLESPQLRGVMAGHVKVG